MIDPNILQQAQQIQWTARHIATAQLQGNYHSAFKGSGMEFSQSREYIAGDDARHLDWNVTARIGKPFVKQYQEEREIVVMLVIDVSQSTHFGTKERFKNELIAEFAAVIAYAAMDNGDKVGLIAFSDQVEAYLKPCRGKSAIWQVIRTILELKPKYYETDLNAGMNFLQATLKSHANIFLISDFLTTDFEKNLLALNQRHHITVVTAVDQAEEALPNLGEMTLKDQETGELIEFAAKTLFAQTQNTLPLKNAFGQIQQLCATHQIDFLKIYPNKSYIRDLIHLLQLRTLHNTTH